MQYLVESGCEDVEEVKRCINDFLKRPEVAARLKIKDVDKIYIANVEAFDEFLDALFEDLAFVQQDEMLADVLVSLLIIYKILARHPELRSDYLLDAVACEYLLHVAVRRQRKDLIQKASEALQDVKQRLFDRLAELEESEW
ncbi:MAG: hypothetical protein ABWK05_02900 [Pyrobaculum sp.]